MLGHGRVAALVMVDNPGQEEPEEGSQPDEGRDDREDLLFAVRQGWSPRGLVALGGGWY